MFLDGFKYWLAYTKGKRKYYRCSRSKSSKCPGKLIMEESKIQTFIPHDHDKETRNNAVEKFRKVLTRKAVERPNKSLVDIYLEETLNHSEASILYPFTQAESTMRKARAKLKEQSDEKSKKSDEIERNCGNLKSHQHQKYFYNEEFDGMTVIVMNQGTLKTLGVIEEIHIDCGMKFNVECQDNHLISDNLLNNPAVMDTSCPNLTFFIPESDNQVIFDKQSNNESQNSTQWSKTSELIQNFNTNYHIDSSASVAPSNVVYFNSNNDNLMKHCEYYVESDKNSMEIKSNRENECEMSYLIKNPVDCLVENPRSDKIDFKFSENVANTSGFFQTTEKSHLSTENSQNHQLMTENLQSYEISSGNQVKLIENTRNHQQTAENLQNYELSSENQVKLIESSQTHQLITENVQVSHQSYEILTKNQSNNVFSLDNQIIYMESDVNSSKFVKTNEKSQETVENIQILTENTQIYENFIDKSTDNKVLIENTQKSTELFITSSQKALNTQNCDTLLKITEISSKNHQISSNKLQTNNTPITIITILALIQGRDCAIAFGLLKHFNFNQISSFLHYVKHKIALNPSIILTSPNEILQHSINSIYPDVNIKIMYFYYAQSTLKMVKNFKEISKNIIYLSSLKMILAMPLIPTNYVLPGFEALRKWMSEKNVDLRELCEYVNDKWLGNAEKISIFNGLAHCIENHTQVFNRDLMSVCAKNVDKIDDLIEKISRQASKSFIKFNKVNVKKTQKLQKTVKFATKSWISSPFHLRRPIQFLQQVSHCIDDAMINFVINFDANETNVRNCEPPPLIFFNESETHGKSQEKCSESVKVVSSSEPPPLVLIKRK